MVATTITLAAAKIPCAVLLDNVQSFAHIIAGNSEDVRCFSASTNQELTWPTESLATR